jgi:hypothetical protein
MNQMEYYSSSLQMMRTENRKTYNLIQGIYTSNLFTTLPLAVADDAPKIGKCLLKKLYKKIAHDMLVFL